MKQQFTYVLYDFFDENTEHPIKMKFDHKLVAGEELDFNDVTYTVAEADFFEKHGTAVTRMTRYKIPDTATQFVHKCPVKKKHMEKLDQDDVIKLEKQFGKDGAAKRVKAWKAGRAKMRSYNKYETKCPLCECVFYKDHNTIPDEVTVDGVMKKKKLTK